MTNVAAIDLFCGVGGLTHGLERSGIKVIAGFDNDETCRYPYEMNNNSIFYNRDVRDLNGEDLLRMYPQNTIKVLAGCAPCQPFSSVGMGRRKNTDSDYEPLRAFERLVLEILPEIVTMENVPNLVHKKIYHSFVEALVNSGYKVWAKLVYAPDYGVPQSRKRLVLLASRIGEIRLVEPMFIKDKYRTVFDAIGFLEELKAGESSPLDPMHRARALSPKNLLRIKSSKPNGTWGDWEPSLVLPCHRKETGASYKSVYGRMAWDGLSPTITTQFYNYGSGRFGHPDQDRALTPREGAILQTFPPDYEFLKPLENPYFSIIGKWIGNAVPVKLAQAIGLSILDFIKRSKV